MGKKWTFNHLVKDVCALHCVFLKMPQLGAFLSLAGLVIMIAQQNCFLIKNLPLKVIGLFHFCPFVAFIHSRQGMEMKSTIII